jgi:hypothetical protein
MLFEAAIPSAGIPENPWEPTDAWKNRVVSAPAVTWIGSVLPGV